MVNIISHRCPRCNSHSLYKYGKDKFGNQKYQCRICLHQFAPDAPKKVNPRKYPSCPICGKFVDRAGNVIGFNDIATGSIISVRNSKDDKVFVGIVCNDMITNKYNSVKYDKKASYITLGDKVYTVLNSYFDTVKNGLSIGTEYTARMNFRGNVAFIELPGSGNELFGVLLGMGKDDNAFDSKFIVRIYGEDGKIVVLDCAEKLNIDGNICDTEGKICTAFGVSSIKDIVPQGTTYDNNDGEMNAYNMALENYEPYKDPRAEGCSSRFDNLVVSKTVPVSRLEEKPVVSETFSFDLPTYSYSDRALNTFPETENWKTYGNRAYALGAFISKEGGSQNLQIDGYVGQEGVSYDTGAALLMNDRNAQAVEMALTFELAHKKQLITEATGDNFFILRAVSKKGAIVPLMKVDGTTISYYAGETAQNATAVSNVTNSDNSITRYKPYRIDFNKANGMVTFYADGMQIGSGNFTSLLNDGISEIRFGHIVTVYDNNDGKISSLNMASENLPPYSNPRAEGCTSRVDNIVVTQMTPAEMLDVETVSLGYAKEKRNTATGYISPLCDTVSVKFNKAVDVSSLGGITVKDAVGTVLGTDNRAYDEESFTYSFRIKDVLQQNAEYYVYIPSTVLEANGTVSLGKNISCKINTAYGYNKIEQPYMTELDENTVEFGVKIYNYEQGEDVYTFAKATYGTDNSFDLEADEIDLTTTPGKAVWYTVDKTKLDRGTKIKTFLFESAANIKPVYECNEYLIQ